MFKNFNNLDKDQLIQLLKNPSTIGHRGSIVFELKKFNCADIVPLLLQCVIAGSFEEVQHSVEILSETDIEHDVVIPEELFDQIKIISNLSEWRSEAAQYCAALFEI